MYKAIDISKYIINKCVNDEKYISNLSLQKILYFIQKEFLKTRGERAFSDYIEAWQFGPVIPEVYYRYCGSGGMTIVFSFEDYTLKEYDQLTIDRIVDEKRELSPWKLVEETYKPNGAWAKTYKNGKGYRDVIPISLIQEKAVRDKSIETSLLFSLKGLI